MRVLGSAAYSRSRPSLFLLFDPAFSVLQFRKLSLSSTMADSFPYAGSYVGSLNDFAYADAPATYTNINEMPNPTIGHNSKPTLHREFHTLATPAFLFHANDSVDPYFHTTPENGTASTPSPDRNEAPFHPTTAPMPHVQVCANDCVFAG